MAVLSILVVQNCSLILVMRYSRIQGSNDGKYIISTAVVLSELLKLLVSIVIVYGSNMSNFCSVEGIRKIFHEDFVEHRYEILKLCIPSGLYVVQNNLIYLAASNLPVSIFQVLSQLKIVTTAIFSVVMLSRKLSTPQYISIVALTAGVALVQYSQQNSGMAHEGYMFGILCILLSCLTSGFSGVYFEKVLKTGSLPLWMRNIHLSVIGLVLGLVIYYHIIPYTLSCDNILLIVCLY
jgi:solute carrier family 35 (UDP-sugar transporter), member A1/2/3